MKIKRLIVATVVSIADSRDRLNLFYDVTIETSDYKSIIYHDLNDKVFSHFHLQSGCGIRFQTDTDYRTTIFVNDQARFTVNFKEEPLRVIP